MIDILLIVFALLVLHYVWFIFSIYLGLNKLSFKENINKEYVSVIIPFRNEQENILRCLKSIEEQNYDKEKYEVIFVDDNSTDSSFETLNKNITSKNIKVLKLENHALLRAHKKAAVNLGIENARGEIIVTTDADCFSGRDWLGIMISTFDINTAFVSGPVEFENNNSLFGKLQKLEFAGLILTGAGLIGSGSPVICNGANLAFRKKVFCEVGGYEDFMNLSSGEDELLMQKISAKTNYNIKFCMNKKAVVKTEPKTSVKEFMNQRKRWASKGLFYKNKTLVLQLILILLFYISLIIQPLLGILYNGIFIYSFLFSFLLKIISEFLVLKKGIKILFNKNILHVFLFAEILQVPYIIWSAISGIFGNYKWKDRELER